jgi:glycosyltransferase involved in cell wall biosynthesis
MYKNAEVTVLMPVFNAEAFLEEAIDSILQQTFSDFEFIIIDDGSTDNSVAIVESYKDERIRFVRNECNLGISETLNRGIGLASTQLIARMDADDLSHPERLQKQYDFMIKHPQCALLSTWANVIAPDKKHIRLERYPNTYYYYNLTFECWIYHPTIMMRKSAVENVGMYSIPYSEDYDLFWKLSREYKIDNLNEPLVDYRLSPTSLNTVLRKNEYDIANRENVVRNIQYYMGKNYFLQEEYLECLRHNFEPLVNTNSIPVILDFFKVLDDITNKIISKPNINRNTQAITQAAMRKREFILQQLIRKLSVTESLQLIFHMNAFNLVSKEIKKSLAYRLNHTKKVFALNRLM